MKKVVSVGLIAILLLFTAACSPKTEVEEVVDPIAVRLEEAGTGTIAEAYTFSGEVAAGGEVQVVPKVAGKIARVAVQSGDKVKQGQVLVQLEAKELALALRQAEAAFDMAKANLNNVKSGGGLSQLEASVRQAEINYNYMQDQLRIMEELYAEGGISLQQRNDVKMRFDVAESQYNSAKEQLAMHQRGEGQLEILAAQLKQAEVGLELARLNYQNATITAPVSGTVSLVNVEVGNMASPGMPVVIILSVDGPEVVTRLTEQAVVKVIPGMVVNVAIPTLDAEYSGTVKEVSPSTVTGTKFYLAKVTLEQGSDVLPGMFAKLRLERDERKDVVLVPRLAVLESEGAFYLFTVKDGKAVRRDVTIGLQDDNFAEILSGIAEGEAVVVAGHHFLRDASPVMVEEGDAR